MTILSGKTLSEMPWRMVSPMQKKHVIHGLSGGLSTAGYDVHIAEEILYMTPGLLYLASTVEQFDIPNDIVGKIWNKSTWARKGLLVWQTILEPGWRGFLTLEMVWLGSPGPASHIMAGSPIAQVTFEKTDRETEGYSGKYQDQEAGPQEAR